MSAAPLKRTDGKAFGAGGICFRTQMSAAPLKQQMPEREKIDIAMRFRTQMSAAPLKQPLVAFRGNPVNMFPHSDECGPIEATSHATASGQSSCFRTQMSAAPLKRYRTRVPRDG